MPNEKTNVPVKVRAKKKKKEESIRAGRIGSDQSKRKFN
jgi:hypothetical protein